MIKSTLAKLPLYYLQVMQPPQYILHELNLIMARFFWGLSAGDINIFVFFKGCSLVCSTILCIIVVPGCPRQSCHKPNRSGFISLQGMVAYDSIARIGTQYSLEVVALNFS